MSNENELAQLRAELEHIATCSRNRDEENAQLRSELDAARKWIEADSVRIGQLRADLARVTAELDANKNNVEAYLGERVCCSGDACGCGGITRLQQLVHEESESTIDRLASEAAALRARVAELETENGQLKADRKWTSETVVRNLIGRNAELVAALRDTVAILEEWHTDRPDDVGAKEPAILSAAIAALALAESAAPDHIPDATKMAMRTPAKHPDTERLDWLERETNDVVCFNVPTGGDDFYVVWAVYEHHMSPPSPRKVAQGTSIRAAIDVARKQGGAEWTQEDAQP